MSMHQPSQAITAGQTAPGSVPIEDFKAGMQRLLGGVTVVTTMAKTGERVGMTATAVSSLSASPPSLLVSANTGTNFARIIEEGHPFCVNVLSADQVETARIFGGMTELAGEAKFLEADWDEDSRGVPCLKDALVRFHCTVLQLMPVATHVIVAGLIKEVHRASPAKSALVYSAGRFLPVE